MQKSSEVETWLLGILSAAGVQAHKFSDFGLQIGKHITSGAIVEFPDGSRFALGIRREAYPIKLCSEPDCGRLVKAKGLCRNHYDRLRKGRKTGNPVGRPPGVVRQPAKCQYPGCETVGKNVARGLCWKHYQALRRAAMKAQDSAPSEAGS